ncbi:MAG: hypothetical protein O2894_04610 [Planctomycetota bacterium]|nr:hypothetical protein [Planctomycetota bacterium]
MAEHYDPGLLPRTYFRAPRVPFDFRALALAVLGFIVFWLGGELISWILRPGDLGDGVSYDVPGAFLAWALGLFNHIPHLGPEIERLVARALQIDPGSMSQYDGWDYTIGGIWFLAVWSFFGLGIHRITTLRIARDEGLPLGEALRFSARHWTTLLLCPVIIAAIIGVFWGCNALAGLIEGIPYVGGLLSLIFGPLRLVSTLLIVLVGVGGIFGMPLISAAAAWECNGSLDAISRAFSYLFARPLQYFWNYFLIFLFTGLILLVGGWFMTIYASSLDSGNLSDVMTVALDPPPHRVTRGPEAGKLHPEYDALSTEAKDMYKSLDLDEVGADLSQPPAMSFKTVTHTPWSHKLNVLLYWVLLNLIWLGVSGYALYWLIGASSSVYADLRADVDGTEEDEVFLEDEDADLDELAEGGPAVEGAAVQGGASAPPATPAAGEPPAADEPAPTDE